MEGDWTWLSGGEAEVKAGSCQGPGLRRLRGREAETRGRKHSPGHSSQPQAPAS